MRSLAVPAQDAATVFDHCVAQVSDVGLRGRFGTQRQAVLAAFSQHDHAANSQSWYTLPRCAWGQPDQIAVGNITKGEMNDLYSNGMVGSRGPARAVYDELLVAAEGRCPSCGGIGHAATLDHYLPKAYFPAYAVLVQNLIPSCQDCNKGLGTNFGDCAEDQVLNPYYDDEKFFNQRWITLEFLEEDIFSFRYRASPPLNWTDTEKARAKYHFGSFKLEKRYAVEAGAEITNVLHLKDSLGSGYTGAHMKELVVAQARSPAFDLNGWRRTFYEGLSNANWFF